MERRKNADKRIRTGAAGRKLLLAMGMLAVFVFAGITDSRTAFGAAQQLETPDPWLEGDFTAAWDRVEHASYYEVKVSIKNPDTGRSVIRSFSTTNNREDLRFFAAGCDVTFSVRAVPSSSTTSKYRASYTGTCPDTIRPDRNNETIGIAGMSSGRYYLENTGGSRMTGWVRVNGCWYYLDPSAGGLAVKNAWATVNGRTYLFSAESKMLTGWQPWNGNWYYLDSTEGYMFTGWRQVTPNRYYYFTETPSNGQPFGSLNEAVTTASNPDSKPPYSLSKTVPPDPSAGAQTGQPSATQPANYWKTNPDGSWSYLKNGTAVKNNWEKVDGFWYYFNNKGIMLTGWQFINSGWYYLEPNANGTGGYKCGAMWANATTPDGYTVNAEGCWVKDGAVVTTANTGTTGSGSSQGGSQGKTSGGASQQKSSNREITYCSISLRIDETAPGNCRTATVTGASNCAVKSVSYSSQPENWVPGTAVTIFVTLEANSGYIFTNSTKYSVNNAKISGQDGTPVSRNVRIAYYPTVRLAAPSALYVNDSYELKWAPVKYAEKYKVVISGGDNGTVTKYVTEPCMDLFEAGDIRKKAMMATVSAIGPEGNSKYFLESDKVTTGDLDTLQRTYQMNGTFIRTNGKLKYMQEDGTAAKGWQQLAGSWYHFSGTGFSDGPGWYQDTTGYWYYFDNSFRMVTGSVTEGQKTYILNDGRRPDLPLGAWIQ